MHHFAGLIPPQKYVVNDATQATAVLILAQFSLQLCCVLLVRSKNIIAATSLLHYCDTRFLRILILILFRLTHSQKPAGTMLYARPKNQLFYCSSR